MRSFNIRRFSGIETKYNGVDQDRGTLRRAVGCLLVPAGAITTTPLWKPASPSAMGTAINNALVAASAAQNQVHFVLYGNSTNSLLVAWEYAVGSGKPRGFWHVKSDGISWKSGLGSLTASIPNANVYLGKTYGADWFGSWIGNRLFLGNGVDTNLVWQDGELYLLGPETAPSDQDDPNQERFPPCTAFLRDGNGIVYAAGNRSSHSLRVWFSERPTARYPTVTGIRSAEWSFRDIVNMQGAQITALSMNGSRIMVHLGIHGAVEVDAFNSEYSRDGWAGAQSPALVGAGAPNPECVQDLAGSPLYFGADGEIYNPLPPARAYNQRVNRDTLVASNRCAGDWNREIVKPLGATGSGVGIGVARNFAIYDEKNGMFWVWAYSLITGTHVCYVYDQRSFAVTGPILYQRFSCVTPAIGYSDKIILAICEGTLAMADLSEMGERPLSLPAYSSGLDSKYLGFGSGAYPGGPAVKVNRSDPAAPLFSITFASGFPITLTSVWNDFFTTDTVTGSTYDNATFSVLEFNSEDMGIPEGFKEFCQVRLHWQRNSIAYVAVFGEADGRRVGKWRGTAYPKEEQICGLGISGRRLKLRIVIVSFLDAPPVLEGITIDWLPGAAN